MSDEHALTDEDRADLVAYLDGELNDEAARALEAKLNLDPQARTEAEAMQHTWDLLDYLPRPEASASFTNRTLDRVSTLRPRSASATQLAARRRAWTRALTWAAVLLLAALGGFAGVSNLSPHSQPPADDPVESDQQLVRDLRVIENKRYYEHIGDVEFLKGLESPDLFGEESY